MEWRDGRLDNQAGTFESKDETERPSQYLRGGQHSGVGKSRGTGALCPCPNPDSVTWLLIDLG